MKHQTLEELQSIADINPMAPALLMTREQRIERWAELLDRNPQRCLSALTGTEYVDPGVRERVRADGSALAVGAPDEAQWADARAICTSVGGVCHE